MLNNNLKYAALSATLVYVVSGCVDHNTDRLGTQPAMTKALAILKADTRWHSHWLSFKVWPWKLLGYHGYQVSGCQADKVV